MMLWVCIGLQYVLIAVWDYSKHELEEMGIFFIFQLGVWFLKTISETSGNVRVRLCHPPPCAHTHIFF